MEITAQDEILVRLRLAQDVLESSENYNQGDYLTGEMCRIKKHCWESLVLYLLLTCLDKLGETKKSSATFRDWLGKHRDSLDVDPDLKGVDIALSLLNKYESENLVKTRFYRGVEKIPYKYRSVLLKELRVYEFIPPNSCGKMLSENHPDIEKIKISCLYDLRNCFTHNLEHNKGISMPINEQCVYRSYAQLSDDGFKYMGYLQHKTKYSGNKYVVDFYGLIFPLFKAVYAAIDIDFDVTTINVQFDLFLEFPCLDKCYGIWGISYHELAPAADCMRNWLDSGIIRKMKFF